MLDSSAVPIYEEMIKIIEKSIFQDSFKEKAKEFARFKAEKGLVFGKLTVLHHHLFDHSEKLIYELAAVIELMILSADIFDDLQDKDNPFTPWSQVPDSIALNIGLGLLSLSNQYAFTISKSIPNGQELLSCIQYYSLDSIAGQHLDLLDLIEGEEDYVQMIRLKSGKLTALACLAGAIAGNASPQALEIIRKYSETVGMFAQVSNDVEGVLRTDTKNDLLNKRRTLPVLYLLNEFNQASKEVVREVFADREIMEDSLPAIVEKIKQSGAVQYAQVQQRVWSLEVSRMIDELPVEDDKRNQLKQFIL
jgi:competence protein ComQ